MHLENFQEYCVRMPGVSEEFPFGPETIVYKVAGKMFALTGFEFKSINLKCDPEMAIELRERYDAVQPGYHMNKQHWNTIKMDHSIADKIIFEWTKNSYDLVVASLSKKQRESIAG